MLTGLSDRWKQQFNSSKSSDLMCGAGTLNPPAAGNTPLGLIRSPRRSVLMAKEARPRSEASLSERHLSLLPRRQGVELHLGAPADGHAALHSEVVEEQLLE